MSAMADEIVAAVEESRKRLLAADIDDDGDPAILPRQGGGEPLASVEVLAYNQGWSLRRCVESIVRQETDFPFEVIIGNDCSTDDTQSVAEDLQREYPHMITIVSTRRNVGLTRNARNVRRLMRGKYAAFCEGDDWWVASDKLKRQVERMEANQDLTLLFAPARFHNEQTGEDRDLRWRFPGRKPTFEWIFDETCRVETASAMCRTESLRRIYEECPELVSARYMMLDTQLFCLLARAGEVECENRVVSARSFSGKSLSLNRNIVSAAKYHDSAFAMKMALCDYFKAGPLARLRSENFYLSFFLEMLAEKMSRRDAVEAMQRLYPEYARRIKWMGVVGRPARGITRVSYCRWVFPQIAYRNAMI